MEGSPQADSVRGARGGKTFKKKGHCDMSGGRIASVKRPSLQQRQRGPAASITVEGEVSRKRGGCNNGGLSAVGLWGRAGGRVGDGEVGESGPLENWDGQ